MRIIESPNDSTTVEQPHVAPTAHDDGVGVVVFGRRDARVRWLQEGQSTVVGRMFPADLVLDDKSLSRQHARLTLKGGVLLMTDLGSTNGVWVRGRRVADAELRAGDSARLGGVTVAVQRERPARLASFEQLMAEARAFMTGAATRAQPLALVLLRGAGELCAEMGELLRPDDCSAVYGGDTLVVLLPGAREAQAAKWVAEVAARGGAAVRAAIAVHPDVASSEDALLAAARAALHRASARAPVAYAAPAHRDPIGEDAVTADTEIVARSERTLQVFALARRAARSELPVLVLGETGTGKEVLARAIHAASPRAARAFRVVNCGALPPSLMESVLFGHEKGSFTGAAQAHAGLFEQADGGTLFLDEVGELSPAAQAALLRVLEAKTLTRLGAVSERKVDVRVLSATHCDLGLLCREGRFREDLMHRLNAVTLVLPPLRERRDEIPVFAERFLRGRELPVDRARSIAPDALAKLCAHAWPGNVRQLKNVVERAAVLALGTAIEVDDLPEELRGSCPAPAPAPFETQAPQALDLVDSGVPLRKRLQQHEADLIRRALGQAGGNRTRAAQLLRMPLRTFMKRLGEYGIE
jgi:DNA-binding NtrC family response regulator